MVPTLMLAAISIWTLPCYLGSQLLLSLLHSLCHCLSRTRSELVTTCLWVVDGVSPSCSNP
ncbi:hypothetical protein BDZ91DRAFT_713750 [Kalaharituber pfeilii]|nr:hypothetical protein BDZ91DRAFT_713750 [Kalaharituber pfeilii]